VEESWFEVKNARKREGSPPRECGTGKKKKRGNAGGGKRRFKGGLDVEKKKKKARRAKIQKTEGLNVVMARKAPEAKAKGEKRGVHPVKKRVGGHTKGPLLRKPGGTDAGGPEDPAEKKKGLLAKKEKSSRTK